MRHTVRHERGGTTMSNPSAPPAGWYNDPNGSGRQRWFDGTTYTDHFQTVAAPAAAPTEPSSSMGPMTSSKLKVKREVSYVRNQKGHSLTWWIILSCFMIGIPWLIYYSVSPNHYWHA